MNKKLLLGAAILSIFGSTLTSCVDSAESASVTNVRDAKAEQLRSIAELNKAMAEKELILANADKATQEAQQALAAAQAAYLQAQAEYERAQAELLRAQAALINAQTEAEKQKLAYELQLLQAELDAKAQELQKAKDELANANAMFQVELDKAKETLAQLQIWTSKLQFMYDEMVKKAQKEADQAKKEEALKAAARIKQLINEVDFYAKALIDAETDLAKDQLTLARIQAGLETIKNDLADEIEGLKYENMYYDYLIDAYNDLIDQLAAYAGEEVTEQDYNNALFAYMELINKYYDNLKKAQDAMNARAEAQFELQTSAYAKNVTKTIGPVGGYTYDVYNEKMERTDTYNYIIRWISKSESEIVPPYGANDQTIFIPEDYRGKYVLILSHYNIEGSKDIYDGDEYSYTVTKDAWTYTFTQVYGPSTYQVDAENNYIYYDSYYTLLNDGKGLQTWLEYRLKTLENEAPNKLEGLQKDLENAQKALAAADKAYTAAVTAYNTANANYEAAQKALPAAIADEQAKLQAWNKAQEVANKADATDAQKAEAAAAEAAYKAAKAATVAAQTKLGETRTKYYDAYYAKLEARSVLDYETANVQSIINDIASAENGVANNASQVADVKQLVADIFAEAANNQANIDAYNSVSKDFTEAYKAYIEAVAEIQPTEELLMAIAEALDTYGGYMGVGDQNAEGDNIAGLNIAKFKEQIAFYEMLIDWNKEDIADLEEQLDVLESNEAQITWNGVVYNYPELELTYKAKIEKDKVNIETIKQLYEAAKAELEAEIEAQN